MDQPHRLKNANLRDEKAAAVQEEKMEIITLREDYIKLGQALKAAALVEDGVEAKLVIKDGEVTVNGEVDTRRGRKLYDGDVVCYNGNEIQIKK